jgi:hypothetical protein
MARRRRSGSAGIATVVALVVLVAGGYLLLHGRGSGVTVPGAGSSSGSDSVNKGSTAQPTGGSGSALALLATLPVKGKAPKTGYARVTDFGAAWMDVDRNGCDTRDDVLRRDLASVTRTKCIVRTGVLRDPYTGRTIDFRRGASTSTAVQIDHVVALSEAWQTGAQQLSQTQRERLANDPINLFAVDGPTNEAKGDGDAATWLPPNKAFRCTYVAHQVAVKAAYHLWVTTAEKAAIQRVLATCPDAPAPRSTLAAG